MLGSCHLPRGKKLPIPWGGPWPARMPNVGGITHQSLPSRMLKPGWIGRPTKWICLIGGQNSPPSQGWRTHRNLLGKSMPPFQFQQLEAGSSWVKGIPAPCPQMSHPECVSPRQTVLSGCAAAAFSLNCGLCPRITVLGREA